MGAIQRVVGARHQRYFGWNARINGAVPLLVVDAAENGFVKNNQKASSAFGMAGCTIEVLIGFVGKYSNVSTREL